MKHLLCLLASLLVNQTLSLSYHQQGNEFKLGADSVFTCPDGFSKITTEAECKLAAGSAGLSYDRAGGFGQFPTGCFKNAGEEAAYFNTDAVGADGAGTALLCFKAGPVGRTGGVLDALSFGEDNLQAQITQLGKGINATKATLAIVKASLAKWNATILPGVSLELDPDLAAVNNRSTFLNALKSSNDASGTAAKLETFETELQNAENKSATLQQSLGGANSVGTRITDANRTLMNGTDTEVSAILFSEEIVKDTDLIDTTVNWNQSDFANKVVAEVLGSRIRNNSYVVQIMNWTDTHVNASAVLGIGNSSLSIR